MKGKRALLLPVSVDIDMVVVKVRMKVELVTDMWAR
jgi:hypothetical protein